MNPYEEGEPAPLGAAATYTKRDGGSKTSDQSSSSAKNRKRAKKGAGMGALAIVVVVGLLALVPTAKTAFKKTPRDKVGISYGGGPFEGSHYQKIVEPGHGLFFNGFFDPLYLYPADQQNYIISKTVGQGASKKADSVVAPSRDRVQIQYQVAVYYKLNTDRLRAFHEQLGLKYNAFTPKGWDRMIQDTFRQQIENALQTETRRYAVADLYGDADLLIKIQSSVQDTLSARLKSALGANFFCAPTFEPGRKCTDPIFIIKQVDVPKSVVAAFEANRTSQIGIITKQNEIAQREAEAKGIQALDASLQGSSGQVYALLKAIESGKINFWVVPNNDGLTLNTPAGGTSAPTPTP